LSTRQRQRVIEADTPRLWNLMWRAAGTPDGSFYFNNEPNQLDQFLVNANMAPPAGSLQVAADTARILHLPGPSIRASTRSPDRSGGWEPDRPDRLLRPLSHRHAGHRDLLTRPRRLLDRPQSGTARSLGLPRCSRLRRQGRRLHQAKLAVVVRDLEHALPVTVDQSRSSCCRRWRRSCSRGFRSPCGRSSRPVGRVLIHGRR
jgi:hypothetical protein